MTKEQAIERLKTKTGILALTVGGEKTIETAIKALEQEPCEDAISRQAVLALPRNKIRNFKGEVVNETIKVTDIETLPSVNPQEQKPCEDCISRQAAIDAVNIGNLHPGIVGALQSILADLPPVTPKQEPCEDAISRQYLQNQFQEKCVGECSCCEWDSPHWCGLIDNAPSVNPQEREVLDKIRADIEHMIPWDKTALSMKLGVLQIIDKYKAESEEQA